MGKWTEKEEKYLRENYEYGEKSDLTETLMTGIW
jgi:hypothetical protein